MTVTVTVDGRTGTVHGRRTVRGESQVFVLFTGEGVDADTDAGVGRWFPASILPTDER